MPEDNKYRGYFLPVFAAAILLFIALANYLLPQFGYLRDSVQFWSFPLLCLGVFLLLRPLPFKFASATFAVAPLFLFGLYTSFYSSSEVAAASEPNVQFWRLSEDAEGVALRGLLRHYDSLAELRGLPPRTLVNRYRSELNPQADSLALVSVGGENNWLELSFPHALSSSYLANVERELVYSAESSFRLGGLPTVLFVSRSPDTLTAYFLAWFAEVLEQEPNVPFLSGDAEKESRVREALNQILSFNGIWINNSPYALSHYLLGTLDCVEASKQVFSKERYVGALGHFRKAAGFVNLKEDPELYSLIFNNAAVCGLFAEQQVSIAKVRSWYRLALSPKGQESQRVSTLALENLLVFERLVGSTVLKTSRP